MRKFSRITLGLAPPPFEVKIRQTSLTRPVRYPTHLTCVRSRRVTATSVTSHIPPPFPQSLLLMIPILEPPFSQIWKLKTGSFTMNVALESTTEYPHLKPTFTLFTSVLVRSSVSSCNLTEGVRKSFSRTGMTLRPPLSLCGYEIIVFWKYILQGRG